MHFYSDVQTILAEHELIVCTNRETGNSTYQCTDGTDGTPKVALPAPQTYLVHDGRNSSQNFTFHGRSPGLLKKSAAKEICSKIVAKPTAKHYLKDRPYTAFPPVVAPRIQSRFQEFFSGASTARIGISEHCLTALANLGSIILPTALVLCTTANDHAEMTLWVKSDVFGGLAVVRFPPDNDRNGDLPAGRHVWTPPVVQ